MTKKTAQKIVNNKGFSSEGFTLIELLVTIAIIAVLSAVLIANMVGIRERAADTKLKNDLNQLKTALRLYYNDNQSYPTLGVNTWYACRSILAGGSSVFQSASGSVYMKEVPENCFYKPGNEFNGDPEAFTVRGVLKNGGDKDILDSAPKCGFAADPDNKFFYVCSGD